tara:strand:- start:279 stop:1007 length:729 start_codon:yes stop_codon:yes gene_type:complete
VTDNYCFTCLKIGDKFDAGYVNKLQNMVRQYSDAPFLCFTDDPTGVEMPCVHMDDKVERDWDNWWPVWCKIKMFNAPQLEGFDRKIFFDLDVIIHGDISKLLDHRSRRNTFSLIRSVWRGKTYQIANPTKSLFNSSCMVWSDNKKIYDKWMQDPKGYVAKYHGTDDFYHNEKIIRKPLPDIFYSYREGHTDQGKKWNEPIWMKMSLDHSIAILHQDPKPHTLNIKEHPIVLYWNGSKQRSAI